MRIFGWLGYKVIDPLPVEAQRCVLLYAPHTSNWDFVLGLLCMRGLNVPVKVGIKKMWTSFPFSLIINPLGGIGIDRDKKSTVSHVDQLTEVFSTLENIALIITPEGSRSLRKHWKTGFFYIAQKAQVPIVTIKGNYGDKTVQFGPVIVPGTPLDIAMQKVMHFYGKSQPKFPKQFSVDTRYI